MRMKSIYLSLSTALIILIFPLTLPAQEPDISFESTELAPGLYMLEGVGGFSGGNLAQ